MHDLSPIAHAAAWRGSELSSRDEWNLELSQQETDELLELGERKRATLHSDSTLRKKLKHIQHELEHGAGAARLLGFPSDALDVRAAKHAFQLLASEIGTPVSQSAAGEKIFSVRDAGFAPDDARTRGPNTSRKLSFHTDRCDVIAFLCYRQAKSGGENDVVSSMTLYNELLSQRPDLVRALMQPYRNQRHNVDTGNRLPYVEQPVFSFCNGHFAANLMRVLIDRAYALPETPNLTAQQSEALDALEELANRKDLYLTFCQGPGDMVFLNNFVTFHRRAEFVDFEDEDQRRHLLRAWLSVPNSRPLDPRFAGSYGATDAGAFRGGMRPR